MAEESVPKRSGNRTKRNSSTWFGSISGLQERSRGHSSRVCELHCCRSVVHPYRNSSPTRCFGLNETVHFQNLPRLARTVRSIGPALARLPFLLARPRLPGHRHFKRKGEYYRGALRSRSGDFSFPRSEFRTAETLRERKVRARSRPTGCDYGDSDCTRTFQIVPNKVQLLECCAESGRSSETAKMQDRPSNWILSAE